MDCVKQKDDLIQSFPILAGFALVKNIYNKQWTSRLRKFAMTIIIYEKRHENGWAVLINRRDFSCNTLLLTRRVRSRSWFLSSGTSEQHNFELSMEKIFLHNIELPSSLMCLIMAENYKPQWKISLSFQILQVALWCQFNLVPHPCKNLSLPVNLRYRFVFSWRFARFWLNYYQPVTCIIFFIVMRPEVVFLVKHKELHPAFFVK